VFRCQHDHPIAHDVGGKCGTPLNEPQPAPESDADLREDVESLRRALKEAREQQAATREILRVISGSPTDAQPVFDTIVRSAVVLCDGLYGALNMFDGEMVLRPAAYYNYSSRALAAVDRMYPMRPDRHQLTGRAILSRTVAHVPDVLNDPEYAMQRRLWKREQTRRRCDSSGRAARSDRSLARGGQPALPAPADAGPDHGRGDARSRWAPRRGKRRAPGSVSRCRESSSSGKAEGSG
jgi:hypothetical protein